MSESYQRLLSSCDSNSAQRGLLKSFMLHLGLPWFPSTASSYYSPPQPTLTSLLQRESIVILDLQIFLRSGLLSLYVSHEALMFQVSHWCVRRGDESFAKLSLVGS